MEKLLRDVIKRGMEAKDVAGVNLYVMKDNKELCFISEGMADIEENREMKRDTIFRLYSQTKPICAAAAMILMERGMLDLFQPVSDFLPGFKNQTVWVNGVKKPVTREATVQDLLNMTSGLFYPDENSLCGKETGKLFEELDQRLYSENPMTTIELANRLGQCTLEFEPGDRWNYGTSADVLGAVIEVVSGMTLGEFMEKEIFVPLGMEDTGFWVSENKQNRLAKSYETISGPNGKELILYHGDHLGIQSRMKQKPAYEAGGAGLASTLDDYMKFAQMLQNGGILNGNRILREATVEYFMNGQLLEHQQSINEKNFISIGHSYGNLVRVCRNQYKYPGLARNGEYGWDGWLGMHFSNFPKENMTILVGMQKKDAGMWALTRKLRNVILSYIE